MTCAIEDLFHIRYPATTGIPLSLLRINRSGYYLPGLLFMDLGTIEMQQLYKYTQDRGSLRSEEHTSELQSRGHLVCRLLLEKKKHIAMRLARCGRGTG